MTTLDGFLILLGATIVLLCAMEGLIRTLILLLSFYLVTTAAGLLTLATEAIRGIAIALTRATGAGGVPNMVMAQTVAFVGLGIPLFVGAYLLSRMTFPDTTIPKIQWLDNVLGLLVGIVLALVIMAVTYNTWGVAVSMRWENVHLWQNMQAAYVGSGLQPLMHQVLLAYKPFLFLFAMTEYPPFFIPR